MTFSRRFNYRALGRMKTGQMNRTETAYANYLEGLRHAGQIHWYKFEGLKLRLADNTFYSPDFFVLSRDQMLEAHEVKPRSGRSYFAMDDSKVKIKIAADMYPFRFLIVWPDKNEWKQEEI